MLKIKPIFFRLRYVVLIKLLSQTELVAGYVLNVLPFFRKYIVQGVFFTGPPPKKLKYGKPRLGEVRCN